MEVDETSAFTSLFGPDKIAENVGEFLDLLYDEAERLPQFDYGTLTDDDRLDDYLTITKVEPGAIWFDGLDAPLIVSAETSSAAQPGWTVNPEAVKLDGKWHAVETANVYPWQ